MWNLLLDVKDLQDNPSVTCGDSSAQGTPYGCPKGEPKSAAPLGVTPHGVGRCPQGRGDRSVRGEPPTGGGGVPT